MMGKSLFEIIHLILRDMRQSSNYFGGIVIVLFGDYMQILRVAPAVMVNIDSRGHT